MQFIKSRILLLLLFVTLAISSAQSCAYVGNPLIGTWWDENGSSVTFAFDGTISSSGQLHWSGTYTITDQNHIRIKPEGFLGFLRAETLEFRTDFAALYLTPKQGPQFLLTRFPVVKKLPADSYAPPISSYPDSGGYLGWLDQAMVKGVRKYHAATDHKAAFATEVRSILGNGVVVFANQNTGAYGSISGDKPGGAVIIRYQNKYGEDFYALYGHLTIDDGILAAYKSKTTTYIKQRQLIGTISNYYDGDSLENHLHFAISKTYNLDLILGSYVVDKTKLEGMVNPYEYLETYCK